MSTLKVIFHSPEDVLNFVNKVSKYPYDMDLIKGSVIVDAKSLLGIMNLGLSSVVELKVYDDNCDSLKEDIEKYVAA